MITVCRSCQSDKLSDLLSLGDQYLSDFRVDDEKPPMYPLDLVLCRHCYLVQLKESTPQSAMYTERYGFKSGVNGTIRANLKEIVMEALKLKPLAKNWLDIASNDGTLLSYVPKHIYRVGIDPIAKLSEEALDHANQIVTDFFKAEYFVDKFDVITSISCFYDMPDPNLFVEEVKSLLNKGGVWSIQQNYLLPTLELSAIDNICHEHLEYYTMLSLTNLLNRHGLQVFRVETNMVNGGCFRTLVCHKGDFPIEDSVNEQLKKEFDFGLDTDAPYGKLVKDTMEKMTELHDLITMLHEEGNTIYIYGASTRGGTIWQMAGLDAKQLSKAVERNPEKVGKKIASIGVPIISEEQARAEQPDYMLVSIWFFKDEVLAREKEYMEKGGRLIFPLPQVKIYDAGS